MGSWTTDKWILVGFLLFLGCLLYLRKHNAKVTGKRRTKLEETLDQSLFVEATVADDNSTASPATQSPLSIQCPICGSVREFDEVEIGEQVKCQCGEVFVVELSASSVDTAAEVGIVKNIRNELFSNPIKGLYGYFKRLWSYTQLTIIQIRNPIFSLDQEPHVVERQKGLFFPILFRFLNPFGTTGQEKIRKLDKGYIAYSKESVSLLVFTVFLQLVFNELTQETTPDTLLVAFMNGIVLVIYFLSIVIFAVVGWCMTRQITDAALSRKIQEAYVYEATMCFGLVVILMNLQAFGIVGSRGEDGGFPPGAAVLTLFSGLHQFYFLVSINRRFKIWTRVSVIFWGCVLSFIASAAFPWVLMFSMFAAGTELEVANRITVYDDQGELDKSIVYYNEAISLDPADAIAYNNRGLVYYRQGDLNKAIADFTKAIEFNPLMALSYYNRGLAYYNQGELEKSIVDYNKAISLDSADAFAYNNRGYAYYNQGELDKAIVDYNKAIALDPRMAQAYNNRGLAYNDQGELDKSFVDYNKAISLDSADASAYNNRGIAYCQQGDLNKAITDYNKAISLDPRLAMANNNRGIAYYQQGDLDKAIADFTKAIELNPQMALAYNNRGLAYNDQGELDKAILDFTKAIGIDPADEASHFRRGLVYYKTGKLELAILDYTKVVEIDPTYSTAYRNRAAAYNDSDKSLLAIADYTKSIEIDPKDSLTYFMRGSLYEEMDNPAMAITDYNKAIELDPQYALAYNNRGHAYYNQGELDKAIVEFTKSIGLDPQLALAYANRGFVFEELGDKENAEADYAKAKELGYEPK